MTASRIALIGLGEVGRVFATDLTSATLTAWDTAFTDPASRASRNAADLRSATITLATASSGADAVAQADLVICAVTAANSVDAARDAAPGLAAGAWFVDLNSSSPGHKQQAAALIDAAGGRYVEAALMSAIGPRRLASPFLLGGPHARDFAAVASEYNLTGTSLYSDTVGLAAATKLCRSVIVKGLESILTESLLAARHYGVEREVLDSLPNILPPADWEKVAAYFVSRSLEHGQRRSEEMQEAAATVAEAGIDPWMSEASVLRQRWAATYRDASNDSDLLAMIDGVIAAMKENGS